MTTPMTCPKCSSADVRFRPKLKDWTCFECGHNWTAEAPVEERRPLHIFLSYGHDEHTASALRIKADLEARGHKVWFDAERLREGRDWEQYIEEGLRQCDKVVLLMTPHSVRRRNPRDPESRDGYCLNEIAKAIEKNKLIVPVMLVTLDDGPPTSICRIQYLDLRDCVPIAGNDERYKVRLERLAKAVEQDDLDFEGGQARLQRLLRPLSFEAEMSRHIARFTGRQWLVAEIDRWLAENPASRVFWLSGPPGIGKSAMATHLVHRRGDVIGYHLCVHGHDDKGDPSRAVLSLAYQVAQHLPEYDKALKALDLEQEVGKHAGTLFDNLFVKPLGGNFPAPEGPRLLVIDAIDEATRGGRNEIAELVRDHWEEVPSWLRLVITSRPEVEVVATLGHLKPFVLDAQRRENLEDLRRYLDRELAERKLPRDARTIDTILAASEAVFLYVVVLLEEIDQGRMSLSRLDDLPVGLAGHYQRFFSRQYPDGGEYRAAIAPLLECICAAREPLPLDVLARAAGLGGNEVRARLVRVGSMFPIRQAPNQEDTIRPFHKSVADWLTALHENTRLPRAGAYFVDVEAGEKRLADACWAECRRDVQSASVYSLRYLPAHLVAVGRGGDAAEVMTEFGYQYQRLKVLGREDVVNVTTDFALVDGAAGLVPAVRGRLGVWRAFHAENAHILRREDALPQTSLLQRAVAHADTSPVTEGAERWLEQVGSEGQWLRPLGRPHERERSACLRTLEGHTAHVNAVAPLPDGRRALSGSWDNTVKLWDLETGQCLRTLKGHTEGVMAVGPLPDGRRALSGSWDSTVKLWDLETGQCLRTLEGHTAHVNAVAPLPDGRRALSGSWDNTVKLWDLETGLCLRTLEGHEDPVNAVAALPDGKRAVSGTGGTYHFDMTLKLWDLETGQCLRTLRGHTKGVKAVALLPDGKRTVSGSDDKTLRLWDLETGQCLCTLVGHTDSVDAVAALPDGKRVISGTGGNFHFDKTLRLWDLETGQCLRTLEGHTAPVKAVALLPDGKRVLSGSADHTLKLWELEKGHSLRTPQGHTRWTSAVALLPDGKRVLSGSADDTLKLWDIETGQCVRTLKGHTEGVMAVAPLPDGKRVLSGCVGHALDHPLKLWDLETGQCLRTLDGHMGFVNAVALLPDGKRALSGSADETLKLWDLETGQCLRTLDGHTQWVNAISPLPDGRRAISGSHDNTLKLWNLETGQCLRTLDGHMGPVRAVALLPDGKCVLSGSEDKTLKLWELETGQCLRTLEGHAWPTRAVALLPDGKCVLSGSEDKTLKLWDIDSGLCLATWQAAAGVRCCVAGPGAIVAGTNAGEVLFLKLMPPGRISPEATAATWHPSRPLLAVARANGTLRLQAWHPESQLLEEIARASIPSVTAVQWSADGAHILATACDGATHILDATTLQPATAPPSPWDAPRETSPDGRWRAVIRDGRLEIVPAVPT